MFDTLAQRGPVGRTAESDSAENIIQRLNRRLREARLQGFDVRREVLGPHQANWCVLGSRKVLFLDSTHSARDQLAAVDAALADFAAVTAARQSPPPA